MVGPHHARVLVRGRPDKIRGHLFFDIKCEDGFWGSAHALRAASDGFSLSWGRGTG
jgi:hypothetical protein